MHNPEFYGPYTVVAYVLLMHMGLPSDIPKANSIEFW